MVKINASINAIIKKARGNRASYDALMKQEKRSNPHKAVLLHRLGLRLAL